MRTIELPPARPPRFAYLDSIRALAAWYVVLHHTWLAMYPSFPENRGPWVLGWLRWGYLAVAVFIVVSGFSLALRPARDGDALTAGTGTFLRRRAFRILPPYWIALAISFAVMVLYTGAHAGVATDGKALAVHALLLQDVIGSQAPNGAFWSIAVEWQIYFLFPLLLWLVRRAGVAAMLAVVVGVVVGVQVVGTNVPHAGKLLDLTPQFLALFAAGMVAGRATARRIAPDAGARAWADDRPTGRALVPVLAVGGVGAVLLLALAPPDRVVDQYFVVSLAAGALVATLLFTLGVGALPRVRRALEWRPLPRVGGFSYSTYLLHIPVLAVLQFLLVERLATTQDARFVLLAALGIPAVALTTWAFSRACERPFVEHRSLGSLRDSWTLRRRPSIAASDVSGAPHQEAAA